MSVGHAERTRLTNRITDGLKAYFPQSLRWFSDIGTVSGRAVQVGRSSYVGRPQGGAESASLGIGLHDTTAGAPRD